VVGANAPTTVFEIEDLGHARLKTDGIGGILESLLCTLITQCIVLKRLGGII
jgi:hypothetical protein